MKRWLVIALGAVIPMTFAGSTSQELLKELEELERVMAQQQQQIVELQGQVRERTAVARDDVADLVKTEVNAAVDEQGLAQLKSVGSVVTVPSWIAGVDLTGDVRFRWEYRERDNGMDDSRSRVRTRFRLGGVWHNADEMWEVAAGLATGMAESSSTNDTWSDNDVFETGDIRLDYAYVKHVLCGMFEGTTLTLGQQMNPFVSSFLLWDSDVRPVGVTAQYENNGLFATLGWYDVFHFATPDETDAQMLGAQIGYEMETETLEALIALAYYHFNGATTDPTGDTVGVIPAVNNDYAFEIGDIYAEVAIPINELKLGIFGEIWQNFGAEGPAGTGQLGGAIDPEDNDMGWVAGVEAAWRKWTFEYAYGHCEADSVFNQLKDSDFGAIAGVTATDVKGHQLGLSYQISEHFTAGVTATFVETIDGPDAEGDLYQVDLVYKF